MCIICPAGKVKLIIHRWTYYIRNRLARYNEINASLLGTNVADNNECNCLSDIFCSIIVELVAKSFVTNAAPKAARCLNLALSVRFVFVTPASINMARRMIVQGLINLPRKRRLNYPLNTWLLHYHSR